MNQLALFKGKQLLPKSMRYAPEWIDAKAEQELLIQIDKQPWLNDLKRRVQHFGYKYDYKARSISDDMKLGSMPEWLVTLGQRLVDEQIFEQMPDQVIINEYQPGQGISPHIDISAFGELIVSLSLASQCIMEFSHATSDKTNSLLLEPQSLLVLTSDARYKWKHGILARKSDMVAGQKLERKRRVSLTFRSVL